MATSTKSTSKTKPRAKVAYTHEEVVAKLTRIRDLTLDHLLESAENKSWKGTQAAQALLSGVLDNLERFERYKMSQGGAAEFIINWAPPSSWASNSD